MGGGGGADQGFAPLSGSDPHVPSGFSGPHGGIQVVSNVFVWEFAPQPHLGNSARGDRDDVVTLFVEPVVTPMSKEDLYRRNAILVGDAMGDLDMGRNWDADCLGFRVVR